MKNLKYVAIAGVLSFSLTSCNSNRNNATLGGTTDTSNVTAGSNAGGVNAATTADTAQTGNKNRGKDSTSAGNVNPSGHQENDTVNERKNHRPK